MCSHKIKAWVEAMRLRTLPVSVAGVITGTAFCALAGQFRLLPSFLCLAFAVLCQVASNFANEYYDYKSGLDRPGRVGPRRGVTEGDLSPQSMKWATFAVLALACAVGMSLTYWGGLWLIGIGLLIALGALAYSAGPYPLSHHALGEAAVVFFFGIIPVNFTFYVATGHFDIAVLFGSVSIGLMGANVLIINNYRDMEDDAAVGKNTLVVKFGRTVASTLYLFNGYIAVTLMLIPWYVAGYAWWIAPIAYLACHTFLWLRMQRTREAALNPFLGITAVLMLLYSIAFLICSFTIG